MQSVWENPVYRYSNVLQGLFHRTVVVCEGDADCRFFGAALDEVAVAENKRAAADDVLFVPSGGKSRVGEIAQAVAGLGVDVRAIVDFDVLERKSELKKIVEGIGGDWSSEMNSLYTLLADTANRNSLWSSLKNGGLGAVPAGPAYVACERLLALLAEAKLMVLEIGETEDFDKSIGEHGAAWVSAALARDIHKSAPLARLVQNLLA